VIQNAAGKFYNLHPGNPELPGVRPLAMARQRAQLVPRQVRKTEVNFKNAITVG
jgi:hypothetical protein